MAEFVRAQIFGTTFEITTRYEYPVRPNARVYELNRCLLGTPTFNRLEWVLLASSGMPHPAVMRRERHRL